MSSFKFAVSVEDKATLEKTEAAGASATIDLDNLCGGLFLEHITGCNAFWTFAAELDLTDGVMHTADTDVRKIVEMALEVFPARGPRLDAVCYFACEVSDEDLVLLDTLADSGWRMALDLRHGICAISPGEAFIKWTFISEVVVARNEGNGAMESCDSASMAVKALEGLIEDQKSNAMA